MKCSHLPLFGLMSIILYLIVRPLEIFGMHSKSFMKEPMILNNQKLIPLMQQYELFRMEDGETIVGTKYV